MTIHDRSKIFKSVRDNLGKGRPYALKCKPDQGKTQACFEKSKVSCHYLKSGDFIRFCNWRFVHKAHLNLLPLNGCKPENPPKKQACRKCQDPFEGLLICPFKKNIQLITGHHNQIVDRLINASSRSWSVFKQNQPLFGSKKDPNIVLSHKSQNADNYN